MTYKVSFIPHGSLTHVLPHILPFLPKSEKWSIGRSKVDDIVSFLYSGQMLLIIVYDEDTQVVYGYTIGEIKQYPQYKMLLMQYAAGEPGVMANVEDEMHSFVEQLAKNFNCAGVEFVGRPGWKRSMLRNGYRADTILYEKFFATDGEVKNEDAS